MEIDLDPSGLTQMAESPGASLLEKGLLGHSLMVAQKGLGL